MYGFVLGICTKRLSYLPTGRILLHHNHHHQITDTNIVSTAHAGGYSKGFISSSDSSQKVIGYQVLVPWSIPHVVLSS